MLSEGKPELLIAFPGSSGTRDMIRRARQAGVPMAITPADPDRPYSVQPPRKRGMDEAPSPAFALA